MGKKWNKVVCYFKGHKKAVPMYFEDEQYVFTRGCPRCNCTMGSPQLLKNMGPPPGKGAIEWYNYIQNRIQNLKYLTRGEVQMMNRSDEKGLR